jgi:hypothetical protein
VGRVNGMKVLTHALPAWIEERGGKLRLIRERAAVIKRIFEMAAAGYGHKATVKKLIAEGVPAFGKKGTWNSTYVWMILHDKRAMGVYQPRLKRGRKPDGPPIPGYFPAAVSEDEWHAAYQGARERFMKRGRTGKQVNIFARLLWNALDGGTFFCKKGTGGRGGKDRRILINTEASMGRGTFVTFPFETFEKAILSCLREIDPHDILNGDDGPDETQALAGQLAWVEGKIAELSAELLKGDVAALATVLRQQEAVKKDLTEKLAEARARAAHPLSESWGECQSLLDVLDTAPDPEDCRLRLRSALRQIVEGIYLVIVPRGHDRLCAVQVWFMRITKHRDYLILHRPPKSNGRARQEGGWWVRSLTSDEHPDVANLDLRDKQDAADLEVVLREMDLGRFETE